MKTCSQCGLQYEVVHTCGAAGAACEAMERPIISREDSAVADIFRCKRDAALLRALALIIESDGRPLPYDSAGSNYVMQQIEDRIHHAKAKHTF